MALEAAAPTPAKRESPTVPALAQAATLIVAALALGLRVYRAAAQSYWYDEGISVALAGRHLLEITRDALADIHPPFYYYVLHFWVQVAGSGEFAVRFVSAAAGAVAVCLVYKLGARLFSPWAGLAGAVFVACTPVLVYYGQEARMYSLLLAVTALWSLVLLRLLEVEREGGRRPATLWIAYLALGLVSVYTHYFAFMLLGVHALWVLWLRFREPRRLVVWAVAMALIPLAHLPWLLNMSWGQLDSFQQGLAMLSPADTLVRMLDDFGLGQRAAPDVQLRLGYLTLFLVGVVGSLLGGPRGRRALVFALLYLGVPVAAMLVLNSQRSAYAARLLILASPGLYLVMGQGIAVLGGILPQLFGPRVGKPAGVLLGTGLLGLALLPLTGSLQALYVDEAWRRDDYRGAVRHIEANGGPGDAIVLDSPYQAEIVDLYYGGELPYYPLPEGVPPSRDNTEAALAGIVRRHEGVWAVFWGTAETDPERIVERWLDAHAFKAMDRWFGGVRLARYLVAPVGQRVPMDVRFGENIRLRGYAWQTREGEPGEVLPLTLFWEATAPIEERYKVFVHLLDDDEKIWGQRDSEPAGGARPTVDWQPGVEVEDRIGVPIDTDAVRGRYQVEIGLYEYPSMQRPEAVDAEGRHLGNRVLVGPVDVK